MGEYVFDHGWAQACQRAGIAYYPKLLGAIPFTPVAGPRLLGQAGDVGRLLDALETDLRERGISGAHINFTLDRDNQLLALRPHWLERVDCQFHWFNRGYRDFQDFLDALTSRKRKQIRKERKQVQEQGFGFEWREGGSLSQAEWDFVYGCYASTYHLHGQHPYLTRCFFSLLAERMPEAIGVVMVKSPLGEPVAMAFFLRGGDTLYGRYWGCLAEFDCLHFETCFYQGLDYAIAHGIKHFDAGAQGEHKLIRGFEPALTHSWHYLVHPGLEVAVADFLARERQSVQGYMEEAAAALPYHQQ